MNGKFGLVRIVVVACAIVIVSVGLLSSSVLQAVRADSSTTCRMMIDPTVQTGPKAGARLQGELKLTVDSNGIAEGTFTPKGENAGLKVTGAFIGRSINFSVDLGGGQYLYAMGNTITDVKDNCGTNWGGIFEGMGGVGIWPVEYIQKPGH